MFKKALVLVLILSMAMSVFAVRLVEPVSKDLVGNDFVGSIAPGSTLELIFSKELGKYDSLKLASVLPDGFTAKVVPELESIRLLVTSPQKAVAGSYSLAVNLIGSYADDTADLYFNIENNLLDASLNNYASEVFVDDPAQFEFFLVNNSAADVTFTIVPEQGVSSYSFSSEMMYDTAYSKTVTVPKGKRASELLIVYPRTQGEKQIKVSVFMDNTGKSKDFSVRLTAKPTLKSKFSSVAYGFPFYSFSLLPAYFLDGFFGLMLK